MKRYEKPRMAKLAETAHSPAHRSSKETLAPECSNSDEAQPFRLVVAYDDFANEIRAREFYGRLVESFGKTITFVPRFLKFEELSGQHVPKNLARDVAAADMTVIAAYENADLPSLAADWIQTWRAKTKRDDSTWLVLLTDNTDRNGHRTPVRSRLRHAARRAGLKFMLQRTSLSGAARGLGQAPGPVRWKAGGPRRSGCQLRPANGTIENPIPSNSATPPDLEPTTVTNAVLEVMRSRLGKVHQQSPFANRGTCRRTPAPETNSVPPLG